MNPEKQKELGRGSLKKYNKKDLCHQVVEIQLLTKPMWLIHKINKLKIS